MLILYIVKFLLPAQIRQLKSLDIDLLRDQSINLPSQGGGIQLGSITASDLLTRYLIPPPFSVSLRN
jgi:hypothetical protein